MGYRNLLLIIFSFVLSLVLADLALRGIDFYQEKTNKNLMVVEGDPNIYSREELDTDLPLYDVATGGRCVTPDRTGSMKYSPYFGWHGQQLDLAVAKEHFASADFKRVIYFGGSAMENYQAPNYLTKIDYLVTKHRQDVRSVNLAESGGRSTNNLVRLILEGVELPADVWVFLDGYNEFNSIRYGGEPEDDFYWTATVSERVHRPHHFIGRKLIEASPLAKKVLIETGVVDCPRLYKGPIGDDKIMAAADYYVKNVKKIKNICESKGVQCLFFLQPTVYSKKQLSAAEQGIVQAPANAGRDLLLDKGYEHVLSRLGDKVIDLRDVMDTNETVFLDEVHFNKLGSEKIAEAIAEHIT